MGGDTFTHAAAGFEFRKGGTLQRVIHQLKYESRPDLAQHLGRYIAEKIQGQGWITEYDALLPIPLHAHRKRKRGYNQADMIAKGFSKLLDLPVQSSMLKRTRNTISQTGLNRLQRAENVKDAFVCQRDAAGMSFLLVDDVVTTGATLISAAAALKSAGVKRIGILVVADALPL